MLNPSLGEVFGDFLGDFGAESVDDFGFSGVEDSLFELTIMIGIFGVSVGCGISFLAEVFSRGDFSRGAFSEVVR
jgi:hypothetical protein